MYVAIIYFLNLMILIHTYNVYKDDYPLWDYNRFISRNKVERRTVINQDRERTFNKIMGKTGGRGPDMGILNTDCDDAENNLSIDWNGSPINYTCYTPKFPLPVIMDIQSVEESDNISDGYVPKHHCMAESITYDSLIPTYGDHRPLWPVFGEYSFVPPQRWLHNIEHGAVVMLYHPCTNIQLIDELRTLVKSCIRKHIIAADSKMAENRPLALISWGHRLLMNHINKTEVISFIRKYALHGPEGKLDKEGQYKFMLISKAVPPEGSNMSDSNLCPTNDYQKQHFY